MSLDPVALEVFANRFASIAEEMGVSLQRTGLSPNIKERRDYSCAVFDRDCEMIAQAAHIPVHLGSMPMSARAAVEDVQMQVGDAVILNDPYRGGTHLPDITIVSKAAHGFYVANRAHHADVGGTTPGSMALSSHIDDEGVRIAPRLLSRGGKLEQTFLDDFLSRVRAPEERMGDLRAQLAANYVGAQRITALCDELSAEAVSAAARDLLEYAERMTRAAILEIPAGRYTFSDLMDDDGLEERDMTIAVAVEVPGDGTVTVDFNGTAAQVPGSVNAVSAITVSACHYVFRCLVPFDIPGNSGVARPITVIAPAGTLVNANPPAPVAGGNVETSQRIVDTLFGALAQALPDRIPAASCGSMNNVTIGNDDFAYYETMAGGAGAGPSWDGASAVHTHMTNTLNTPVEAIERAYPFRVRAYSIRRGSGGAGAYRGGDGVVRELEMQTATTVTLLTERRRNAPWGLAGGSPGKCGENQVGEEKLPSKVSLELAKGDVLILRTPGGGGYGTPDDH